MSRSLSIGLRQAMYAQQTGEVFLAICSISHASIPGGVIRVVNDLQNMTSDGNLYAAFPFQVTLPADGIDGSPRVRLVLDSVDRTVIQAVRGIPPGVPPTVQVDLVLASQPDTIEISFPNLTLRNVDYDQFVVEGDLALDEDDREPIPYWTFSPQHAPGLF